MPEIPDTLDGYTTSRYQRTLSVQAFPTSAREVVVMRHSGFGRNYYTPPVTMSQEAFGVQYRPMTVKDYEIGCAPYQPGNSFVEEVNVAEVGEYYLVQDVTGVYCVAPDEFESQFVPAATTVPEWHPSRTAPMVVSSAAILSMILFAYLGQGPTSMWGALAVGTITPALFGPVIGLHHRPMSAFMVYATYGFSLLSVVLWLLG